MLLFFAVSVFVFSVINYMNFQDIINTGEMELTNNNRNHDVLQMYSEVRFKQNILYVYVYISYSKNVIFL